MLVQVATSAAGVSPGIPTVDLAELRQKAPLASWAALVRRAQDQVYRWACEGETAAAIVGEVTSGRYTRKRLRSWARHYELELRFADRQID